MQNNGINGSYAMGYLIQKYILLMFLELSLLFLKLFCLQALAAHKFREQQEYERKRALEEARNREIAKQNQIKERREKIMESERQRREELLKRNMVCQKSFLRPNNDNKRITWFV